MKLSKGTCGEPTEKEIQQEDELDPIFDCCDMLSMESQLIELKDQEIAVRRRSLMDLSTTLDSLGASRSMITGHFLGNKEFVSQYGTDSSKWASKMRDQIMTLDGVTYSTEGQKIQDFFRWGIEGLLAGMYLKSLSRIERVLSKRMTRLQNENYKHLLTTVSQYLPDYQHANELLHSLIKFQDIIGKYVKRPESVSTAEVKQVLKEIGIVNGKSADTQTDWEVSANSFALRYILAVFTGGFGAPFGAQLGLLISEAGEPIGSRGWNSTNVAEFSKQMLGLVRDALGTIKEAKSLSKRLAKYNVNSEVREVSGLIKKCIRTHKDLISILGRGICVVANRTSSI